MKTDKRDAKNWSLLTHEPLELKETTIIFMLRE